jgi:hypothetical protein
MRKVNLKKFSVVLAAMSMIFAMSLLAACGQGATADTKTKPVKVEYKDEGKVVPNKTLYLVYYHPTKKAWVEIKAKTNKQGIATFKAPLNKGDATCSFYFATSENDLNEKRELAENDKLRLFRVPEDTPSLGISMNEDGGMFITEGNIQMWSKE